MGGVTVQISAIKSLVGLYGIIKLRATWDQGLGTTFKPIDKSHDSLICPANTASLDSEKESKQYKKRSEFE